MSTKRIIASLISGAFLAIAINNLGWPALALFLAAVLHIPDYDKSK